MQVAFQRRRKLMFKYVKILLILFLILSVQKCFSQQWVSTYSNHISNDLISEDKAFSIAVSNSGFVYVTGFCSTDSNGTDICTIKYNQEGDTVWTQVYNGSGNSEDKAYAIVIDDLDNIYITGYTTDSANGIDIVTIKYNSDGERQWTAIYNGTSNTEDKSQALCIDQNGNVYVTGYATNTGSGKDIVVLKYTTDGTLLWPITYNYVDVNGDDIANAIVINSQGDVIVTGSSMGETSAGTEDMLTLKLAQGSGNFMWVQRYNGPNESEDKAYAITIDDLDNIIITGYVTNLDGNIGLTTIKYSSSGLTSWRNIYDSSGYDSYARSIAATPDGYVVSGTTKTGPAEGTEDYITIKYSNSGVIEWVKTYDGSSSDISYSLVVSEIDNAVYVTGSSMSDTAAGTEDMFTIEYDLTSGTVVDTARYDVSAGGEDVSYDIAIDTSGNVYITGYTAPLNNDAGISNSTDYVTVKYTGGHLLSKRKISGIPYSFALYQNYPNPFNPSTKIKFSLPQNGIAKLAVYDILGREVEILVNQNLTTGDYSVEFNGSKYASGVYFYELKLGNYRDVKKMVLIK
jgi:uncharacterized delta-60 repeat protein